MNTAVQGAAARRQRGRRRRQRAGGGGGGWKGIRRGPGRQNRLLSSRREEDVVVAASGCLIYICLLRAHLLSFLAATMPLAKKPAAAKKPAKNARQTVITQTACLDSSLDSSIAIGWSCCALLRWQLLLCTPLPPPHLPRTVLFALGLRCGIWCLWGLRQMVRGCNSCQWQQHWDAVLAPRIAT